MFLDWLLHPAVVAKGGDIVILWYYFGGVGLGLIVLAVTSLIVPDPPPPKALFTSKDKASIRPQQQLRQAEEEEAKKPSSNDNDNNNKKKKEKENKTDPFDLPPNQIEKIRKTFRLTHAQMEEVLDESRRQHNNNNDEGIGAMGSSLLSSSSLSSWTPHQKMNGLAYLLMLSVLVYVLNRDYGNVVTIWFVQTFPKEARTLGLLHPLP